MKRICLLLDKNLQSLFTLEAHKRGITKASLLKDLIDSSPSQYINYKNYQKKNILYNFRLNDPLYKKLISGAKAFNVSIGEYLRSLIVLSSQKSTTKSTPESNDLYSLWQRGRYGTISKIFDIEKLNNVELLYFANAQLEIGCNDEAIKALDLLAERIETLPPADRIKFIKVSHLIKADIAIRNRDLPSAERHLAVAGDISLEPIVRTYWGYYYCLKGEVAEYKDEIDKSFNYYEKALEYLDIVHHGWFMMRIYIRIARSWKYKAYYTNAKRFLSKAFELNKRINNVYYNAWNHMDLSFYLFVTLNLGNSVSCTRKAIKLYSLAGNRRGEYYGIDNLGRIELERGNTDQAYLYFTKAREIERTFRPKEAMSSTDFYLSFIEAKNNYSRSKEKFEDYAKGDKAKVWPTFHKYFQNASKYIYALEDHERKEGETNLKRLSKETQNILVATAATNTLKEKRVMPIR